MTPALLPMGGSQGRQQSIEETEAPGFGNHSHDILKQAMGSYSGSQRGSSTQLAFPSASDCGSRVQMGLKTHTGDCAGYWHDPYGRHAEDNTCILSGAEFLDPGLEVNMSLLSTESEDTGSWCVVPVATLTVSEAAVAFSWITFSGFGHFQWPLWMLVVFSGMED